MCWNYTVRFTEHDAQSAATLPLTRTFLSVRRWQEKGTRESYNVVAANEMRDAIICARAPRASSRLMITYLSRSPDPSIMSSDIPIEELPHCEIRDCGALLRPDIIWFGEQLDANVLEKACV